MKAMAQKKPTPLPIWAKIRNYGCANIKIIMIHNPYSKFFSPNFDTHPPSPHRTLI
jgi:hypothetical protein